MAQFSVVIVTAPPFTPGAEASAALTKLDGREALLRSVELFLNRDEIKQVQLVVPADLQEDIKRKHGAHLGFSGVALSAAAPRFGEQIAVAAAKLNAECSHVIIHDAARPCVPYTDIDALESAAAGKAAITSLCVAVRSGLVQLDEGGLPVGIVNPNEYAQLVLPMLLTKAKFGELAQGKREPHASEMSLLKASPLNVRIGGAADQNFARAMLSMMPKPKSRAASSPFEEAQW